MCVSKRILLANAYNDRSVVVGFCSKNAASLGDWCAEKDHLVCVSKRILLANAYMGPIVLVVAQPNIEWQKARVVPYSTARHGTARIYVVAASRAARCVIPPARLIMDPPVQVAGLY